MRTNPIARILTIVTGRTNKGRRVYYALEMDAKEPKMLIPEQVVLKRWRLMKSAKLDFHGCRLSPTIWRGLSSVDFTCAEWEHQVLLATSTQNENVSHVKVPAMQALRAMLAVLGPSSFGRLCKLGYAMIDKDRFGTPDLFLWTTCRRTGLPKFAAFLEVKKPKEPVSKDQRLMIWALKRLGAKAEVVRLREV